MALIPRHSQCAYMCIHSLNFEQPFCITFLFCFSFVTNLCFEGDLNSQIPHFKRSQTAQLLYQIFQYSCLIFFYFDQKTIQQKPASATAAVSDRPAIPRVRNNRNQFVCQPTCTNVCCRPPIKRPYSIFWPHT